MATALVTGAGRGLGAAIASRLAEEGYDVVVNDIDGEAAADTAAEIEAAGGRAVAVERDVAAEGAAADLLERAVSEYGRLDVLVNNAAIETVAPALELSDADWERVRSVNLDAVFRLTRAAGRQFRKQGDGGDVVNITSFHDTWPRTGKIHYDTAKAGVRMLTKDFALELAEHDVAVNCVAPGVMATPMNAELQADPEAMAEQRERIPWGRLGEPEEVADAVAFLVEASYITGVRLPVDGGVSLVG
jgi:glucose 1-dehydrogenase